MPLSSDLENAVLTNEPYTQGERQLIRQSLSHAEARIMLLQNDIKRAAEEKERLEENVVRYKLGLAPHRLMHEEALRLVFRALAADHGSVSIPLCHHIPPQVVVSHVCRGWRRLALSTKDLWSEVDICRINKRSEEVLNRWFARAHMRLTTLGINFERDRDYETAVLLRKILLQIRVKTLRLKLSSPQLQSLGLLPQDTFYSVEDVNLSFTDVRKGNTHVLDNLPHFVRKTKLVAFEESIVPLWLHAGLKFPWSQLLHLRFAFTMSVSAAKEFLIQVPMLEELSLVIRADEAQTTESTLPVILSHLHDLNLGITGPLALAVPLLKCPNVTKLGIVDDNSSSIEVMATYESVKILCDLQKLEDFDLQGGCVLLSTILKDAPMLRVLRPPRQTIVDYEAIAGMSSGILGRRLISLTLSPLTTQEEDDILEMLQTRYENVQTGMEKGWRDQISLLKEVRFDVPGHTRKEEFKLKKKVFKKLGISLYF